MKVKFKKLKPNPEFDKNRLTSPQYLEEIQDGLIQSYLPQHNGVYSDASAVVLVGNKLELVKLNDIEVILEC